MKSTHHVPAVRFRDLTTHDATVRIGSQRRYVLLNWRVWGPNEDGETAAPRWVPEYRTDVLPRAIAKAWGRSIVLDSETGEVVFTR